MSFGRERPCANGMPRRARRVPVVPTTIVLQIGVTRPSAKMVKSTWAWAFLVQRQVSPLPFSQRSLLKRAPLVHNENITQMHTEIGSGLH